MRYCPRQKGCVRKTKEFFVASFVIDKVFFEYFLGTLILVFTVFFGTVTTVSAQSDYLNASVLEYYEIENGPTNTGEIILKDVQTGEYNKAVSSVGVEKVFFGVVVEKPVLYFKHNNSSSSVPIIRTGIAEVKVSNINGNIKTGDTVTFSQIPGIGQKIDEADNQITKQIVGVAQADFPAKASNLATSTLSNGEKVLLGQIPVDLSAKEGGLALQAKAQKEQQKNLYTNLARYILATLIALGSIYIAYKNFSGTMKESIISIGRNPLAKDTIHSAVIFNSLVILLILAIGFFLSFAIIII